MPNRRCICSKPHPEKEVFSFKNADTMPYVVALKKEIMDNRTVPLNYFDFTPDGNGRAYCGHCHYNENTLGLSGHLSTPKTKDTLDEANVPLVARVEVQKGDIYGDKHLGKFFVMPMEFDDAPIPVDYSTTTEGLAIPASLFVDRQLGDWTGRDILFADLEWSNGYDGAKANGHDGQLYCYQHLVEEAFVKWEATMRHGSFPMDRKEPTSMREIEAVMEEFGYGEAA